MTMGKRTLGPKPKFGDGQHMMTSMMQNWLPVPDRTLGRGPIRVKGPQRQVRQKVSKRKAQS